MEQAYNHLRPGGWLMVNIMDPKVQGKRYMACNDLVNHFINKYEGSFIGQIGMRIMSRPKSIEAFEGNTREEKKQKYLEWQAKWFVEPVWCFRKPNGSAPDLFSRYTDSVLEGMGPVVVQSKQKKPAPTSTTTNSLDSFFE